MRIRKNANVSSYMNSHASGTDSFQTHVCQLNQSPWDVIPFSHHHTSYPFHQLEDEDSFNGNGSLVDSIGAVESVAFMMEDMDEKPAATIIDHADETYGRNKKRMPEEYDGIKPASKPNKKSENKSYQYLKHNGNIDADSGHIPTSGKKQDKTASSHRARGEKGSSLSSGNPYEFYYYSGFGPSWGKRRGSDRGDKPGSNSRQVLDDDLLGLDDDIPPSPPPIEPRNSSGSNDNQFDYVNEDDEGDDEDEISGKKRMRKRVKARSLKSLM